MLKRLAYFFLFSPLTCLSKYICCVIILLIIPVNDTQSHKTVALGAASLQINPPDDGVGRPIAIQSPIFLQDTHHFGVAVPANCTCDTGKDEIVHCLLKV